MSIHLCPFDTFLLVSQLLFHKYYFMQGAQFSMGFLDHFINFILPYSYKTLYIQTQ